jgi:hypothetical protein
MLAGLEQSACFLGRSVGILMLAAATTLQARAERSSSEIQRDAQSSQRDIVEQTHRAEGEAILALADAAMAGKPVPIDFRVRWENDFIKAQRGTFVPFTLSVDTAPLSKLAALVYVRARRRDSRDDTYAVDAIFPVELKPVAGQASRISRGFSVAPGDYDVLVVIRERVDPGGRARGESSGEPGARRRGSDGPKAAVMRQPLSVPEFRSGELTTSTMIVADRVTTLAEAVPADQLAERPYVIGHNEITPAADRVFRKDEELVVVFLVYNPMVTTERQFDLKVEYHFFRKVEAAAEHEQQAEPVSHPPARAGERYFNRTDPQRFNPALMGAAFDPLSGEPVLAGQVVPLAGFQEGEYRLGVQVIDLLSGKSISRDVFFTVGS